MHTIYQRKSKREKGVAKDSDINVQAEAVEAVRETHTPARRSSPPLYLSSSKYDLKRRITLPVNEEMAIHLEKLARQYDTSLVDMIRKFIRLGIFVLAEQEKSDSSLLLKGEDGERELVFLF